MAERLKKFQEHINPFIRECIEENESMILDMNAESQLFEEGITRTGIHIADFAPYSPYTIQIKQMKGQPTNRVTLRDTGDFESSFFLEVTESGFEIKASDWKAEKLSMSYGSEIMGLTDKHGEILTHEFIKPKLMKEIQND